MHPHGGKDGMPIEICGASGRRSARVVRRKPSFFWRYATISKRMFEIPERKPDASAAAAPNGVRARRARRDRVTDRSLLPLRT